MENDMKADQTRNEPEVASPVLILSGGVGLGAYQGGAVACLSARGIEPVWLAGSSVGAVNAAVIAAAAPNDRVAKLEALWQRGWPLAGGAAGAMAGPWRHATNWATAIGTRMMGATGFFHPRMPRPFGNFRSFYDLEPLRERVSALVDFERLNGGTMRTTIAATDLESGELVLFDTARGDRIEMDHLLASCGFLPEFAPVEIGDRMFGDGGLSANAPIEALHVDPPQGPLTIFVIDLFARDGARPASLEDAITRKNDLTFSNQTWQRLEAYCREHELRRRLDALQGGGGQGKPHRVLYLSYRPEPADAISDKTYDYSPHSIDARWQAGRADMEEALGLCAGSVQASAHPVAIRRKAA